jgi:hypothetical protein
VVVRFAAADPVASISLEDADPLAFDERRVREDAGRQEQVVRIDAIDLALEPAVGGVTDLFEDIDVPLGGVGARRRIAVAKTRERGSPAWALRPRARTQVP